MEPDIDNFADILLDTYDINEGPAPAATTEQPDTEIKQDGSKVKKKKLDEELLLGEGGLTLLRTETQHLKFRGKGHEDEDLHKLISYYTVWANNLYPKYNFQDFAQKVTKPASSARVKETMNVWRNEFIDRRNIRMGINRGHSDNDSEDENQGDATRQNSAVVEDDESSEDDNRPLFFPITTPLPEKSKPKKKTKTASPKKKSKTQKETVQPKSKEFIESEDEEEDEEPLFSSGTKRRIVAEPEEDEEEEEEEPESRESALARLAKMRQEREIAKRANALKRKEEELQEAKAALQKPEDEIMNEYEDAMVELALSEDELDALNKQ